VVHMMKDMFYRFMLTFAITAVIMLLVMPARGENLLPLNHQFEQTNFVVNKGCSGTMVDARQKLVLTAFHCILDKEKNPKTEIIIQQNLFGNFAVKTTTTYVTEVVAADINVDLALLRLVGPSFHVVASPLLENENLLVPGQKIYIVGNPNMLELTITVGYISNLNRVVAIDGHHRRAYQVSGGFFGGVSGGAVYTEDGFLIGVPSFYYPAAPFMGFAIPVPDVREFLTQYKMKERS